MTESFDIEIANKQTDLEALKSEMETIRQQFIKSTAFLIAQWYNETTTQHVSSNSGNTIKLGREKLSTMKAKIKELVDSADKIASDFLSEPSLWWHLTPKDVERYSLSPYEQRGCRYPEVIDKQIRRALGKLGVVFEEFGYGITTKGYPSATDFSVWNESHLHPYADPKPYYPYRFDWSNDMQNLMKKYNEVYKKALDVYSTINSLQLSKQTKQASDLWKSA